MIESEYKNLVDYIEKMIADGVQLVHAGRLIDWQDTEIPEQIARIKEKDEGYALPKLNPGDQLKHKISEQDMWVINDDGKTVFLNAGTPTIKFPLDKLLDEFTIIKRANNNI